MNVLGGQGGRCFNFSPSCLLLAVSALDLTKEAMVKLLSLISILLFEQGSGGCLGYSHIRSSKFISIFVTGYSSRRMWDETVSYLPQLVKTPSQNPLFPSNLNLKDSPVLQYIHISALQQRPISKHRPRTALLAQRKLGQLSVLLLRNYVNHAFGSQSLSYHFHKSNVPLRSLRVSKKSFAKSVLDES